MSHVDARVGERDKRAEVDIDFELPIKSVVISVRYCGEKMHQVLSRMH